MTQADSLLLNPQTKDQLNLLSSNPPQAILISGPSGSGKYTLGFKIASEFLGLKPEAIHNYPYFLVIKKPDNKSEIPIEAIRELISKLKLMVPTGELKGINRVVLINEAHRLTTEAQNALLKVLEEPPSQTSIILTTSSETDLLPTVLSRLQKIHIVVPSLEQSLTYFSSEYSQKDIQSTYLLSRGSTGLQSALLAQQTDHPLKQSVDKAKLFLGSNRLEKLIFLHKIAKNKDEFIGFLDGLSRAVAALHEADLKKGKGSAQLLKLRKSIQASIKALEDNANPRLVANALGVSLQ
jgi:DNA polymerase-3 subunit delta'